MSDLLTWLERLGLSKYAAALEENDVDLELLRRLSEQDLRELGLPLGARKRILQAVAETHEPSTTSAQPLAGRDAEPVAAPERRQITVMFADIVGATSLSEELDPEDLRSLVLAYQEACAEAVSRHGGHIAQYLGDGILAYFGYPQAHEDDAVRGVRAALALIERSRERTTRLNAGHEVSLEVRVGLDTGLVVAGQMGAGATREQLAIGEAPNVAARVQGLAEPGTVLVSHATWRLVEGFFTAAPLGPQALKGVSRPLPVYRIIAPTSATSSFEARATRNLTPLVSREVELGFLRKRWEQALDGEGQVVLLQGEAGIGKSRLIRAFREQLAQDLHEGITLNCSSQHQASALYPVVDQLSRVLDFALEKSAAIRRDKLVAFILRLGLPVDELGPPLAALLGIGTDERLQMPPSEPDQLRSVTFKALEKIVTALSRERPLLFIVEDAHWIDPSTQELLGHIIDMVRDKQVLVLLTARPEYRPPWVGLTHVSTLSLNRLSRRETKAMIQHFAAGLTAEVLAELVSRTDGVPLFIEELTKSVLELQGSRPARPNFVPVTLQEALAARLDRLAPIRQLIQVAALLGRVFDVEVLQTIMGMGLPELNRALDDLVKAGLVYRRPHQPIETCEFKHALIQEAALNTLVRQNRTALHARVGETLERIRPELRQRQPEVIAYHWQEAGDNQRAWPLWRDAGVLAARRLASLEAVQHFTHATHCLNRAGPDAASREDEARIYLGLARALMQTQGYRSEQLAEAMESAQHAAWTGESVPLQVQVALDIAPVFYGTGRNAEYLALVRELDHHLSDAEDRGLRAALRTTSGVGCFNRGEYIQALRDLQAGMDLFSSRPPGDPLRLGGGDFAIVVRSYLLGALAKLGRLDEAFEVGVAAVDIGRSLHDPFSLAWGLLVRSNAALYFGNYEAVLAAADELIAICRQFGFKARLGNGLMRRGYARALLGEVEEGIEEFRQGRLLWGGPTVVFHALEWGSELAHLLLIAGKTDEAAAFLDEIDSTVSGTDEANGLSECQRIRGLIAAAEDDAALAERWFEMAIGTARRQGALLYELRATNALVEMLANQDRKAEALRRLGELYALFTQGYRAPDLQMARSLLDRLSR